MCLFFQFVICNKYLIEKLFGNTDFSSPIDFSLFCLRIQETMQQFFQSYCNTILAICILPVTPFSSSGHSGKLVWNTIFNKQRSLKIIFHFLKIIKRPSRRSLFAYAFEMYWKLMTAGDKGRF